MQSVTAWVRVDWRSCLSQDPPPPPPPSPRRRDREQRSSSPYSNLKLASTQPALLTHTCLSASPAVRTWPPPPPPKQKHDYKNVKPQNLEHSLVALYISGASCLAKSWHNAFNSKTKSLHTFFSTFHPGSSAIRERRFAKSFRSKT